MFRSLILAAVLLASAPLVANAGEITLLPSINYKLAIATIMVTTGTVAAGATVITGVNTMNGAITAGVVTITAGIAAGIKVKPTNAAIAKAGKIATTDAAAGDEAMAAAAMVTGIINRKREPSGSLFNYLLNRPAFQQSASR